jgi:hypothetical protein
MTVPCLPLILFHLSLLCAVVLLLPLLQAVEVQVVFQLHPFHLIIHPWCHQIPPWTHLQMNLFTSFLISMRLLERAEKFHHCRVEWERHALIFLHEKQFDSKYRMSNDAFKKLVSILEPALEQNNAKSINSCKELAISPSHILGLMICWCNGSSFHDICDAGNFSRPTFFRLLWKGIYSIVHCTRLQMVLSRTAH